MKKVRILILSIICVAILAGIAILIVNENYNINQSKIDKKAQGEQMQEGQSLEAVSLKIDIKQEKDESYKCLLTFTANSKDNKIKSIEYPAEEGKEPQIIQISDETGREEIGIDYEMQKDDIKKTFKVVTINGNTIEKKTAYTITYDNNMGEVFKKDDIIKGSISQIDITNLAPTKAGNHFLGWSKDKTAMKSDYFENGKCAVNNEDMTFYAIWAKAQNGKIEHIDNESLIGKVSKINTNGVQNIEVNGVTYSANVIIENNDLVLDGEKQVTGATLADKVYEFGNKETDVAKANADGTVANAPNMVILKVNGNLTVNYHTKLTACKSDNGYGGPKGIFIYCTGTLSNNGTIDMTARGARAEGQDVYLWKNTDNSYEYVAAQGGIGGRALTRTDRGTSYGISGEKGTERKTRRRRFGMRL